MFKLLKLLNKCEALKDDKEFVKEAVANSGSLLSHVSDRLKDDKEVVLLAASHFDNAIKYASEELQKDEEIIKVSKEHWYDDRKVLFGPDDLPF